MKRKATTKRKREEGATRYRREGTLERIEIPTDREVPSKLHLLKHRIDRRSLNGLNDFFEKAEAAAAELHQRGPLIKSDGEIDDLGTLFQMDAKRLRWLIKRLRKSIDAGTPRMDLYMALGAGMALVTAWQHLDGLAPPDKRWRITTKLYFDTITELQQSGKKITQQNIADQLDVSPQKLRAWIRKHLIDDQYASDMKARPK